MAQSDLVVKGDFGRRVKHLCGGFNDAMGYYFKPDSLESRPALR